MPLKQLELDNLETPLDLLVFMFHQQPSYELILAQHFHDLILFKRLELLPQHALQADGLARVAFDHLGHLASFLPRLQDAVDELALPAFLDFKTHFLTDRWTGAVRAEPTVTSANFGSSLGFLKEHEIFALNFNVKLARC